MNLKNLFKKKEKSVPLPPGYGHFSEFEAALNRIFVMYAYGHISYEDLTKEIIACAERMKQWKECLPELKKELRQPTAIHFGQQGGLRAHLNLKPY
jgi:hypothetical protein